MPDTGSFATLLRTYRKRARLTQRALAEACDIDPSTIGKLERGERVRAYPYTISQIAAALSLSPEEHALLSAAAGRASGLAPSAIEPPPAQDEPPALDGPEEVETEAGGEYFLAGPIVDADPGGAAGDAGAPAPDPRGWRLDILAALTISVGWLRWGADRMPARRKATLLAIAGVALVAVTVAAYVFAQVGPAVAATRPFASAGAQGWLVSERKATDLPRVLAVMNAQTGAWRPLWPDERALSATQAPASAGGLALSLAHPRAPAYSPARHMLAFIADRDGGGGAIWVAYIMTGGDGWPAFQPPGASRVVADCGGCGALAWSPDGAWLLYDTQSGLRALALTSGDMRTLTTDAGDRWPACSPDGRWLAFQHGPNNDGGIVAVAASDCLPINGSSAHARYLNGIFPAWRPAWSLDGSLLAFTSYAVGTQGVVRVARFSDLTPAPDYNARTAVIALSPYGCHDPAWAARGAARAEALVFTCDNPSAPQHHGTVVITPGAMAPAPWQAVADTGVNAFEGICWLPS